MSLTLFLFIVLTASVTVLVVLTSLVLVALKNLSARRARIEMKLRTQYGNRISEFLVVDLPPPVTPGTSDHHLDFYRAFAATIESQWSRLSRRRRTLHRTVLLDVLVSTAADVAGETSDRLVFLAYEFGFVQELLERMRDRRWWIRAESAQSIGLLKARGATAALAAALEDAHPGVRLQALRALLQVVGVEAFGSIFQAMRNLSMWEMMELSVSVKHHGPDAVPYLLDGLRARDVSIVELCIELLAEVGFVEGVQTLRNMAVTYPNIVIRAKAIEALGRLGDGRSEEILIAGLSDPHPMLRSRALGALRVVGTSSAVGPLTKRLSDGPLAEKIQAARALAAAGAAGWEVLRSSAQGPDGQIRDAALQVLEEIDVPVTS